MESSIAPKFVLLFALLFFNISFFAQPIVARILEARTLPEGKKDYITAKENHFKPWNPRPLQPCLLINPSCRPTYGIPESPLAESDLTVEGITAHDSKLP